MHQHIKLLTSLLESLFLALKLDKLGFDVSTSDFNDLI